MMKFQKQRQLRRQLRRQQRQLQLQKMIQYQLQSQFQIVQPNLQFRSKFIEHVPVPSFLANFPTDCRSSVGFQFKSFNVLLHDITF